MNTTSRKVTGFDLLARAYARSVNDFFFIQVGANDGKRRDPIYHLVMELGWKGVLIEPQKAVFNDSLVSNYAGNKNVFFENVAIDEKDGSRELFKLSFSQQRWATGLASFKKSHLEDHIDNGYVATMAARSADPLPIHRSDYIEAETVSTMTFASLINKYQIEQLNLLQIDTEGYDYQLLRRFDFEQLRPPLVQFEHHVMTQLQKQFIRDQMHAYGYLTFKEGINIIAMQTKVVKELQLSFDVLDLAGLN